MAMVFWAPIIGTVLMGWIVCARMTYSLTRDRRVGVSEWVSRMVDASLISALVGVPIGFGLYVATNSGF